ncbi:MAG: hemolysin family protein [Calditrichia bacterium]
MLEIIIILISLVLTFYFSGTETAFITVNKVRVELWRRQKTRVGELVAFFLKLPERFIYTTLVGNNIANVAFASYATLYLRSQLQWDDAVTWLTVTTITVMLGEIIPKTLFRSLADWLIKLVVFPLYFFYGLFYPMIWALNLITRTVMRATNQDVEELQTFFSKTDLEILLRESGEQADLDENESEILNRVLHLRNLRVKEAMIPRTEIVAVPVDSDLDDLLDTFQKTGFTKIPVYGKNLDDIVGVVILKDLFNLPTTLSEIIRPIKFVPETKKSLDLLREFKNSNTSIAIVIDEYGGTSGLVTTEDLLEEVVGDIEDEFDESSVLVRKLDENTYSVSCRIELDELEEELGLKLPKKDYETLSGYLLSEFGHIPRREEVLEGNGFRIVVTKATRRKVDWVRIEIK